MSWSTGPPFTPRAVPAGDENGGALEPRRFHAPGLGAPRYRHLYHACTSTSSTASTISGRCSTNWSAANRGAGKSRWTASRTDPKGPLIDLREELIKHLGQRVSMLSDYQLPITTTSERLLFAIEAKNPKAVAAAIAKLFKDDKTVQTARKGRPRHLGDGGRGNARHLQPRRSISAPTPPATPTRPLARAEGTRKKNAAGNDEKPLLPHAAVTVYEGNLVIASHIDFLLKVIAPEKKPEPLVKEADYLQVDAEIEALVADGQMLPLLFADRRGIPHHLRARCGRTRCRRAKRCWRGCSMACLARARKARRANNRSTAAICPTTTSSRRYLGPAGMQITSRARRLVPQGLHADEVSGQWSVVSGQWSENRWPQPTTSN